MDDYGVDVSKVFLATLISAILTATVIVGLTALYYRYQSGQETSERFLAPPAELEALQTKQRKRLTEVDVVDRDKGIVAIPIDRAMRLVVDDLSQSRPAETSTGGNAAEEDDDER